MGWITKRNSKKIVTKKWLNKGVAMGWIEKRWKDKVTKKCLDKGVELK